MPDVSESHLWLDEGLAVYVESIGRPRDDTSCACWQSAANRSPVVKFPDHRENTGNIADIGPSSHAEPLQNQPICDEIP